MILTFLFLLATMAGTAQGATYSSTAYVGFMWCTDLGCSYRNDTYSTSASATVSSNTVTRVEAFGCFNTDRPWTPVVQAADVRFYADASKSSLRHSTAPLTGSFHESICSSLRPSYYFSYKSTNVYFSSPAPYVTAVTTYTTDGSTVPVSIQYDWSTAQGPLW